MENQNQNLIAALQYYDVGFSVIPIEFRGKKPLVVWQQYQVTRASKEQIEQWFNQYPNANVGVVTGAISGIVVIDIDTIEKIEYPLPETATSRTGRDGRHLFCKHPGQIVKNRTSILPHVDIRGDGGYVVMPPSIHENGNRYEWIIPPKNSEFAELPEWVLEEKIVQIIEEKKEHYPTDASVLEGKRNDTATRIAGKLLSQLKDEKLWEFAWGGIKEWNRNKCVPPLSETELQNVFNSIAGSERAKRNTLNKEIKAISLLELIGMNFPTPKWLVERLIPHEAVTIISGAPASYKTFLTLEIALKVAGGEKVFGEFQTTQSPVLIIDEENHPRVLQERAKLLSQNPNLPIFVASKNNFLLGEESVQKIIEYARDKNVQLVIFDSFICIHDSDENVASEMRNVMKHLKDIANQGIAVIVIHHHRKNGKEKGNDSQDIRGSSDIAAQVDCHLAVERKGKDASVTIQQKKLREAQEIVPFVVHFHSDGNSGSFEYAGVAKEKQNKRSNIKISVKKVLEETEKILNKTELWELVKKSGVEGGEATFKTAIKEMVAAREIFIKKGTKNTKLFSLKEFGADDG